MKKDPATLVIFGATGNLAQRKLLPALYKLEAAGLLDHQLKILCNGRRECSQERWLECVSASVHEHLRAPVEAQVL